MSGTEIKGKRAANNALWEKHKYIIESLYLKDGMSLKATMEVMAVNHGFNMNKAQYETMFKKWDFRKNIAAKEWSSVNRSVEDRRAHHHKESIITIGKLHVNPNRVKRARARYSVSPQDLDSQSNAHSHVITVRTPPPPDLDFRHNIPANLPWFCFLSKYSDKPMHLSAIVLNTGREIIRSFTFEYGSNKISVTALHRTMQQEIFGRLRPHLLSKPDGDPTINLEQAFGLTTKTPHLEFLKLAAYMLSNNIILDDWENIGMKMIKLCHSRGMLRFLEHLLTDKQCTLRVMAEKLLVCAVCANDKTITRILLKAGASPKAKFRSWEDALTLAIRLKRTELLPFLICAGAREDEQATQLTLEEVEDISFKFLLKLSLETSQPSCARKLLEVYRPTSQPFWNCLLHRALVECDLEIIELVLIYEAGQLWQNPSLTCLEVACSTGNIQKVRLLLRNIGKIKGSGCGGFRKCLPYAVKSGNRQLVEYLLTQGARIDDKSSCGISCLHSVDMNDLLMVQYLLDRGADPNHSAVGYGTPLHAAARSGDMDTVKLLLDRGADPNHSAVGYSTPSHVAARIWDMDTVKLLLDRGADPNYYAVGYGTPLHAAARSGDMDTVKLLFEHGAKLAPISGSLDSQGDIVRDAVLSGDVAVVEEMLKAGAAADLRIDEPCATALQLASSKGSIDIVRLLLSYNADINAPPGPGKMREGKGVTVLTAALRNRDIQLVSYLLDQGADVNNPPAEHEAPSPLQVCIEFLDYETMVQLLARGANPEDSDALWKAVVKKDSRSVNLLLDLNRKVLSQKNLSQGAGSTDYGRAALSEAIISNQSELVSTLSEAGIDFKRPPTRLFSMKYHQKIVRSSGKSPMLAAIQVMNVNLLQNFLSQGEHCLRDNFPKSGGHSKLLLAMHSIDFDDIDALEILKLLNGTVAEINSYYSMDSEDQTLLQRAIYLDCCPSVVKYLLSVGADINSPAGIHNGRTALQAAAENDRDDIVEILIRNGASVNAIPSSYRGATAFQFAAMSGNFKIFQLLLEVGADAFAPRGKHYGRTAIEGAADFGCLDMVVYLLHLADGVEGVEFEHQLCRARKLARKSGHIVLSETILEHQKDRYRRLHCKIFEGYDADLEISGDDTSDEDDSSDEDDGGHNDSYICDVETDEQSKPGIPTTSFASPSLPIRGLNIDGMLEVRELDSSMDCDSPNIHNIPTHSNCSRSLGQEDTEYEINGVYEIAPDVNPNLPDFTRTSTQEREDNQMTQPNPLPDNYLINFLDIPGSMATPQWNEFEVPDKSQTFTENDLNLPDCMIAPNPEREDEPMVIHNLPPNDYSTDFLDIPGSMATPKWDGLDDFYEADMEE